MSVQVEVSITPNLKLPSVLRLLLSHWRIADFFFLSGLVRPIIRFLSFDTPFGQVLPYGKQSELYLPSCSSSFALQA